MDSQLLLIFPLQIILHLLSYFLSPFILKQTRIVVVVSVLPWFLRFERTSNNTPALLSGLKLSNVHFYEQHMCMILAGHEDVCVLCCKLYSSVVRCGNMASKR